MPGIVGLITSTPREVAVRELRRMVRSMCHEEFYVTGMWVEEALGIYVGWVTRKGSFCDGMPVRNERGDVILLFAGEEFPDPGTTRQLKQRGHQFDATGPAYLVHLYEEDDGKFPAKLNGRFHGLVVDRGRGKAVLFNDRFGMRRIYYYESKEGFYFAAEAKAILAVRPELRTVDPQALGEFLACGAVLENRTLFPGVHVLPPASAWIFCDSRLARRYTYFHPEEWENLKKLEPEVYYRELKEVFSRNLPRYFSGPEVIAMSLTGGLDTRMILAWQKPVPGSLRCYTFGSMFRENQDVRVARRVAAICKQSFEVLTAGAEFLSDFPHYAERAIYLSDGCADVSSSTDVYFSKKIRDIAPIRMTGNYGGEILRGVRAFKPEESVTSVFCPELLCHIYRANETYRRITAAHPVSFAAFKQGPWYHYRLLAIEETQLSTRSPFLDNEFVQTVFRGPDSVFAGNEMCFRLIADGNSALAQIPTDRGFGGKRPTLWELTSRFVLDFLFKAEYACDMGMPQWLARVENALPGRPLERVFLGRHKISHFRIWYRDYLADYVRDMLLDARSLSRWYVNPNELRSIVEAHTKGIRNLTIELHNLLSLELIHRVFLDRRQTMHGVNDLSESFERLSTCMP